MKLYMLLATPSSSWTSGKPVENPVAAGWSTQMTLALLVQLYGFFSVPVPFFAMLQGPFSASSASWEEQPGPPVSHSTSGSVDGLLRLSNIQKKYLVPIATSKYPECCFTLLSQIVGLERLVLATSSVVSKPSSSIKRCNSWKSTGGSGTSWAPTKPTVSARRNAMALSHESRRVTGSCQKQLGAGS